MSRQAFRVPRRQLPLQHLLDQLVVRAYRCERMRHFENSERSRHGDDAALVLKQAIFCPPPGLSRWLTGLCTTQVAPELRNVGSAKACVHRDKPGVGICWRVSSSDHAVHCNRFHGVSTIGVEPRIRVAFAVFDHRLITGILSREFHQG